jgi:hypothetical protein
MSDQGLVRLGGPRDATAKDREVSIKLGPAHGWSIVTSTRCNLPPLTKSESRKALNQVESSLSEGCLPMHFTISSCREYDFAESLHHWSSLVRV